jgi:hypothetical protein
MEDKRVRERDSRGQRRFVSTKGDQCAEDGRGVVVELSEVVRDLTKSGGEGLEH